MTRLSKRERRLLFWTVGLGLLALLQIIVVRPALQTVRRLRTKVLVSTHDVQRMRSVMSRKGEVERAYEEIRNRITSTRSLQDEIIDMLLTIERAAHDAGVEVLENIHVRDDPLEYFHRHTVRFKGRAKPEQLMRMIYALQDPQLLLKIPEMKFAMRNYNLEMELDITRVVHTPEEEEGDVGRGREG